jgi:DNA polymerase-3 subunit alpha
MKIANELADFTLGDADILRRAMGKKIPEEMEKQKEKFLTGAKKKKINPKKAERIFDLMAKFAEYGFNKSHSAAYAMIAYQTAYLKTHFPVYFMAALLTSEADNTDKIVKHIIECHEQKIDVLPPDVNESYQDFIVIGDKIRFGLKAVKNVGTGAIESIISARGKGGAFKSIFDFCERVNLRKVNKRVLESLIKCGAFDSTEASRSQMMAVIEEAVDSGQIHQKSSLNGQISMFEKFSSFDGKARQVMLDIPEWPENQLLNYEKEVLGFYITGHPLAKYQEEIKKYANIDTVNATREEDGKQVKIAGIVTSIKEIIDRKGGRMAFVTLEDLKGSIEAIVYAKKFKEAASLLRTDIPLLISGNLSVSEENTKLIATDIIPLSEMRDKLTSTVHFTLPVPDITPDRLEKLKDLLAKHRGTHRSYIHLIIPGRSETIISLGDNFKLNPSKNLLEEVNEFFGDKIVNFQ